MRRNALLAKPPKGSHGLGVAGGRYFKSVVGRLPTEADYEGVHTTSDEVLAAVYAFGTSERDGDEFSGAYPVILELDTRGLKALPDVDALASGIESFGDKYVRGLVKEALEEGKHPYDIVEWLGEEMERGNPVGEDPAGVYVEEKSSSAARALLSTVEKKSERWQNTVFKRWAYEGIVPEDAMIRLVDQRRYLFDFNFDRVLRVHAVQRWWNTVLDNWWEIEDKDLEQEAKCIEERGYHVVTLEDVANFSMHVNTVNIYDSKRKVRGEFHGTSSFRLAQAFPELVVPPDPYPISPGD